MKKCKTCGIQKDESEFYSYGVGRGLYSSCKECHRKKTNKSGGKRKTIGEIEKIAIEYNKNHPFVWTDMRKMYGVE